MKLKLPLLFLLALTFSACSSNPHKAGEPNPDPLEKVNRVTFAFNDTLDRWILKPVAKGYRFVSPGFVESGVNNFFSNLGEVPNIVNDILQWKWKKAGNDTGRLLINSTIGVVGLFDVAKHAGLKPHEGESFGQTFTYWGIPEGPYIVLPFFGSYTATDVVAMPLGWYTNPVYYIEDVETRLGLSALSTVNTRANLLDAESFISGDKYLFIRNAYLQRRQHLVNDGQVSLDEIEDIDLDGFDEELEGFDEDF